jgi:hypothetical protein
VTRIKIYLEGGGDFKEQKSALRQGMTAFLGSLRDHAESRKIAIQVVVCGGRQKTFEAFEHSVRSGGEPEIVSFLLVDAERDVELTPREHLEKRDRWKLNFASDECIHLMVQTMETWIIADPEKVSAYYKKGFVSCLPKHDNLEKVPKAKVRSRCPSCDRLFTVVKGLLAQA